MEIETIVITIGATWFNWLIEVNNIDCKYLLLRRELKHANNGFKQYRKIIKLSLQNRKTILV